MRPHIWPSPKEIPAELQGRTECGPRAIWATLRFFGLDRSPDEIKAACGYVPEVFDGVYNRQHGTYLLGVAIAFRKFNLEVEWSGDDPEVFPEFLTATTLRAEAERLHLSHLSGMTTEELLARLAGHRVAIVSHTYFDDGGAGHITPTSETKNGRVIFPLETVDPTVEQLEVARKRKDQCREVVLVWVADESGEGNLQHC